MGILVTEDSQIGRHDNTWLYHSAHPAAEGRTSAVCRANTSVLLWSAVQAMCMGRLVLALGYAWLGITCWGSLFGSLLPALQVTAASWKHTTATTTLSTLFHIYIYIASIGIYVLCVHPGCVCTRGCIVWNFDKPGSHAIVVATYDSIGQRGWRLFR